MVELPTGTVTFLFTDIEGSTRAWEQHPQAMPAALARHDQIMRTAIEQHRGYVFKTVGDAFYAAFTTAPAGVAAAIRGQHDLTVEPWDPAIGRLRVRMALHSGAPELRNGDYFGTPLNRVARLLSIGHGGQILLSRATAELVRDVLPPEVTLRDLGMHRLKDVRFPEHVSQVAVPFLQQDFPPLLTVASAVGELGSRDLVFGLAIAGQARAYPIATLQRVGVLNDELGGQPIAIVCDPNSDHPTATRRMSGGRSVTLAFDVNDSAYLTNAERTVWWDRRGRLITTLKGTPAAALEPLDGILEWWDGWKSQHPNTTVYMDA